MTTTKQAPKTKPENLENLGTVGQASYQKVLLQFRLAGLFSLFILSVGMVFYHTVEKLSWVDAFYFCTVTLTTVGYGDITPKTEVGKIFTAFYILIGIGIIGTFAKLLLDRAVAKRKSRL
jgi:voltage-gated potassium channel